MSDEGRTVGGSREEAPKDDAAPLTAAQREVARAKAVARKEEERQLKLVEEQARLTEDHRKAWDQTDAAVARRQQHEAERIMHGPSPQTQWVDYEGTVRSPAHIVGDPTRGPSS